MPQFGITPLQKKLLKFIQLYADSHDGVTPSYAEMCNAIDVRSKSIVSGVVQGLIERGQIQKLPNKSRSIQIISQNKNLDSVCRAAWQVCLHWADADLSTHVRNLQAILEQVAPLTKPKA